MNKIKKIIALIVTTVILSVFSVAAYAEEHNHRVDISFNKHGIKVNKHKMRFSRRYHSKRGRHVHRGPVVNPASPAAAPAPVVNPPVSGNYPPADPVR
ncbi:MAG: hypothetical protein L7F77_06165 [Candidatus Magnetominusculus sp. LBB02]|nr:hypothetical protein [Candidatus Magnetominusculus sp. LBB02]